MAALLWLAACVQPFDAAAELTRAMERLAAAESYTFDRTFWGESTREGRTSQDQKREMKGRWHKQVGTVAKMGATELARVGDKIASSEEGGPWRVGDAAPAPGAEPKKEPGLKLEFRIGGGGSGGPSRYATFNAPHLRLASAAKASSVVVDEETQAVEGVDCVVFKAVLTEAAVKEILQAGGYDYQPREGEEPPQYSGTSTVWVDDQWNVRKVDVSAVLARVSSKGPRETTRRDTIVFSGINETTVDLPRGAEGLLVK
jgi:hypothetical protein